MLRELVAYLDERLGVAGFPADAALNGLQVEGRDRVARVALAVDACAATFRAAADSGADLVIVHHGLFWGGVGRLVGSLRKRVGILIEKDISLYACHLPLDAHGELGNNAGILKALRIRRRGPFGTYHGVPIGWWGELPRALSLDSFVGRVQKDLETTCTVLPFGGPVKKVGVVSGGGGSSLFEAEGMGLDTVITGEPSHPLFTFAEETGLNVIFAGHYATETLGVKAVGEELRKKFHLRTEFIHHPTGL